LSLPSSAVIRHARGKAKFLNANITARVDTGRVTVCYQVSGINISFNWSQDRM